MRKSLGDKVIDILIVFFMLIVVVVMLYPLWNTLILLTSKFLKRTTLSVAREMDTLIIKAF